jgi:hypothetical protein
MYKSIGGLYIYGPTKVLWETNLNSFLYSILEQLFGTVFPQMFNALWYPDVIW